MGENTYVPVPEFYAGKSVFITGGAGFLGKVLVEKLLYSCPKVDKVYLLLRDKKNVSAEQRLLSITSLPLFSRLLKEKPENLDKIVLVKGDISSPNLSMNAEDFSNIIKKVSVVIHSAATIKFNEPLKVALNNNLEGTKNVLSLCHLIKNLEAFVHVSTAYISAGESVIEEKVYTPHVSIEDVYKFVAQEEPSETQTAKFIGAYPNTYTFTKALSERLISETHGDIPVAIVRPSIVTPSKDEPVKGWVDNWYGATAALSAVAKGLSRAIYTTDKHILDLIPVDYVSNLTLIAAAKAKRQTEVAVYNLGSGTTNPITMRQVSGLYNKASSEDNFYDIPYPNLLLLTKHYWLVKLINLLMLLIAYVADIFTGFTISGARYTKQISQIITITSLLEFFSSTNWIIKTDRTSVLFESLSPSDAKTFPCLATDINWAEYIPVYYQGVKKYLIEKKKN